MSWVSICRNCVHRDACIKGEFRPTVIHDPDDCEGDECLGWEPCRGGADADADAKIDTDIETRGECR